MPKIYELQIRTVHSHAIRTRTKCSDCGKRRLCTQVDYHKPSKRSAIILVDFLCNDCLCKTPDWP